MEGISNKKIVKLFAEKANDDVKKIYQCFSFQLCNKVNNFHRMVRESGAQYPFILMNTDRSDKKGMHWWSFLDSNPKKEIFLFNSFSLEGLEEFILQDDQKVLIKIPYGTDKFNKKDNKITLITLRFSMKEYEKIKNMNRLSESTIDLLHLMNQYGKKHKLKNEVIVHLVDHQLQVIKRDTCGMYQIYFYVLHVISS